MSTIMLVVRFLPLVIEVIRALENVFPQKGFGPFKLSVATTVLSHIYDLFSGGAVTKDALFAKMPDLITSVVTEMNKKPDAWTDPTAATAK